MRVRVNIPITSFGTLSFVTRVTKARTGQGLKLCVPATRPTPFFGYERLRGILLVRAAVRRDVSNLFRT